VTAAAAATATTMTATAAAATAATAVGTDVGTLKDGYVHDVPLPRVPPIQSASLMTSHESIAPKVGISLPGYLQVSSWIPTLPKLGSILGFSQRFFLPFSPIAIKAKNYLLY
jgi:hypothetical protein